MNNFAAGFTLQLFHLSDQEANTTSVALAPNLSAILNTLAAQDIDGDGAAGYADTLILSSGDAWIPGLFYDASEAIYGIPGAADILIQNELGVQAIAFGNHEFDNGTPIIADLLAGIDTPDGLEPFGGADFPYLSGNIDFGADASLAPLVTDNGQDVSDIAGRIAEWAVVTTAGGERIGLVASTTPAIDDGLTSPGNDVVVTPDGISIPRTDADFAALAASIQADVDALLAANPDIDKVILLSHQQVLSVEVELAERLRGVDIIMAGGSNSVLLDADDAPFGGDDADDVYPIFRTGTDGAPVAVINTDKSYEYLGRLVIDFDDNGEILPDSYDTALSGAFATDNAGVARVGATGAADPEIVAIAAAVEATILEGESDFFGVTEVFLNAERDSAPGQKIDGVRSQETNLGNLTADANLWYAGQFEDGVVVSFKNGGGIRQNIGTIVQPGGGGDPVRLPPEGIEGGKPEGGVSRNNVADTLAFNNGLSLLSLTTEQLVALLESTVANYTSVEESAGDWGQFAGLSFSFDADRAAGDRIVDAALETEDGTLIATLVENGEIVDNGDRTFRTITLNFLADGGNPALPVTDPEAEGYDAAVAARVNRVDLVLADDAPRTGGATFAPDGSEQDALAEYLLAEFGNQPGDPAYDEADTEVQQDLRIQNLGFRPDTVLDDDRLTANLVTVFPGAFSGDPEGASEVVAHEAGRLFVTNGNLERIDVFDIAARTQIGALDLSGLPDFGGVQSVAVKNGLVAAAVQSAPVAGQAVDGFIAFYDAATLAFVGTAPAGVLPDQIVFTPDGNTLLVANEAEFNAESDVSNDAGGSVSVIAIDRSGATPGFAETRISIPDLLSQLQAAGVRIDPNFDAADQFEPEYISVTPDGRTAIVALQENNAAVVIDIATKTVSGVLNLGTVDHALDGNELDFNDDDAIEIVNASLRGLRQPDAHVVFAVGGTLYLATANEGDGRGDAGEGGDEARVGDILAGEIAGVAIDPTVDTEGLERIAVSTVDGDTDDDGDIDVLHSFGGRGFTIFDLAGNVVFDAGSDLELIVADLAPERFLDDDGEDGQNRADAKGVEPEAIAFGEVGGTPFLFVGAERDSGVFVFDVSDPTAPEFVEYIDGFENGLISPEIITFISAADSVTGTAQIAVSYEISGETAVFDLFDATIENTVEAFYEVALGRQEDAPGLAFWTGLTYDRVLDNEDLAFFFTEAPEFFATTAGFTTEETVAFMAGNATGTPGTDLADLVALAETDGFDAVALKLIEDNYDFV